MSRRYFCFAGVGALLNSPAAAQFGVANERRKQPRQPAAAASVDASGDVLGEIMNDPELLEAVEMLSEMSPEEMEETLRSVADMFGDGDPETAAALREAAREVSEMDVGEMRSALGQMAAEKDVSDAASEALRMLNNADEGTIGTILERKDLILEAVVQSGQITEEDAERYRADPVEWERELKSIWEELRRQAKENI